MTRAARRLGRILSAAWLVTAAPVPADETCQSPYMPKVTGQEDYLYVWTLGSPRIKLISFNPSMIGMLISTKARSK